MQKVRNVDKPGRPESERRQQKIVAYFRCAYVYKTVSCGFSIKFIIRSVTRCISRVLSVAATSYSFVYGFVFFALETSSTSSWHRVFTLVFVFFFFQKATHTIRSHESQVTAATIQYKQIIPNTYSNCTNNNKINAPTGQIQVYL